MEIFYTAIITCTVLKLLCGIRVNCEVSHIHLIVQCVKCIRLIFTLLVVLYIIILDNLILLMMCLKVRKLSCTNVALSTTVL